MHYRLVSLWDFIMYAMEAGKLAWAIQGLSSAAQGISMLPRGDRVELGQREHGDMSQQAQIVQSTATAMGLASLAACAGRLIQGIDAVKADQDGIFRFSGIQAMQLVNLINDLTNRMPDEFGERIVLVVPATRRTLFEQPKPLFGPVVHDKFKKKGRREISEAGKCLALSRPTACVFHLMRAVEVGLEAVRTCLGASPPTKGQHRAWGAAIGAINQEIEGRENLAWPRQWISIEDKKFFEEVAMALVAIKDGCRDDTMHVESIYTPDEADHLFALTKGVMQKIASRLDEDGEPSA